MKATVYCWPYLSQKHTALCFSACQLGPSGLSFLQYCSLCLVCMVSWDYLVIFIIFKYLRIGKFTLKKVFLGVPGAAYWLLIQKTKKQHKQNQCKLVTKNCRFILSWAKAVSFGDISATLQVPTATWKGELLYKL